MGWVAAPLQYQAQFFQVQVVQQGAVRAVRGEITVLQGEEEGQTPLA